MNFRSDIAGLRAVAVLPIVLFHAGVNALPGGFVGVDIFFVISGFLITSLIVRDLEEQKFSIWTFYRRRVARIVPALLLVLLSTLIFGKLILFNAEYEDLVRSAIAALAFVSNVFFYQSLDYFGNAAEAAPLIHTWSLAVEEQFYIFYPVLLILVWRWIPQRLGQVVLGCVVLSFLAAFVAAAYRPEAAFYLLPARAWELGLGAIVALGGFPNVRNNALRQSAAMAGLAMILGSMLFVSAGPLFPAPLALFPVVGTALLIAYGQNAVTGRFLALKPMQWVGDVSYSLYLWHWPIITIYRLQTGFELTFVESMGLVSVSLVLAGITYVCVEKPCLQFFRRRKNISDKFVTLGGLSALVLTMGVAVGGVPLAIAANGSSAEETKIASFLKYTLSDDYKYQFRRGTCFIGEYEKPTVDEECLTLSDSKPNMIVMGDSHAAALWRAIEERYHDYNVVQVTASGCRPIWDGPGVPRCTNLMKRVFYEMVPSGKVDTIVLAGRWSDRELAKIRTTVDALAQRNVRVFVVGPTVEYDGSLPSILARAKMTGDLEAPERARKLDREVLETDLAKALNGSSATYIPMHPLICSKGVCRQQAANGDPYQFDYGHLTLSAAREIVGQFPAIEPRHK